MKILICTGIFVPESGGPATYSAIMATELSRKGHAVRIITYSDELQNDSFIFPVIRIVRMNKLWNYMRYFFAVMWFGKNVDVLYLQDTVSAGLPAYLANKILQKKMAIRVVGDYSWEQAQYRGLTTASIDTFQEARTYPGVVRSMRSIQRRVVNACTTIITPSIYLKNLVTGWGISSDKITVIYNAIDIPAHIPGREEARNGLRLSKSTFSVVSAGRDVPWKGFGVLREVADEMNKDIEKVKLTVLSGEPREKVLRAVSGADVFVLNTGYEGFPFLVLEAMSLGTPVVTTSIGGNPELIKHEESGLLVPYNDKEALQAAIDRLLNDARLRKHLAKAGLETVKNFTVERMSRETEQVLTN